MNSKNKKRYCNSREKEFESVMESDEIFSFIIGYTAGGFPYGVTWEEINENEEGSMEGGKVIDDELPFD